MMKCVLVILFCSSLFNTSIQAQNTEITSIRVQLNTIKDSLRQADLLNRLGFLMYEKSIDSTFFYTRKARAIAIRHHYQKGEADALTNIGVVYDVKGYAALAIYYYNKEYFLCKILDIYQDVFILNKIQFEKIKDSNEQFGMWIYASIFF